MGRFPMVRRELQVRLNFTGDPAPGMIVRAELTKYLVKHSPEYSRTRIWARNVHATIESVSTRPVVGASAGLEEQTIVMASVLGLKHLVFVRDALGAGRRDPINV